MKILLDSACRVNREESLSKWATGARPCAKAGFSSTKNGELLIIAEGRWDVLLTSDRNIKYQQNMTGRNVSIVIPCAKSNRMKDVLPLMPTCADALLSVQAGQIVEVGPR